MNNHGFMTPSALFFVVVLCLLSFSVFKVSQLNSRTVVLANFERHAEYSAKAGVGYLNYRLQQVDGEEAIALCESMHAINVKMLADQSCQLELSCRHRLLSGQSVFSGVSYAKCGEGAASVGRTITLVGSL